MPQEAIRVLPGSKLTLKDRLSRLTFLEAAQLLGSDGQRLIQQNANNWTFNIPADVYLGDDLFRVSFPKVLGERRRVIVTITLMAEARRRLHYHCNACEGACEHVGAVFSLVLEEKTALGLAEAPPKREPVASLSEEDLVAQALAERAERARTEKMTVKSADPKSAWADYSVTNRLSGRTYRVALRGLEAGESFCTCPDFRTNTLGTCKHILKVASLVQRKFPAARRRTYRPKELALHLQYDEEMTLRLLVPSKLDPEVAKVIAPLTDRPITDLPGLMRRLAKLQKLEAEVVIYPDAEEFIEQRLAQDRLSSMAAEIRRNPARHPLRATLLRSPLLPYQMDGIAFAVGAGRSILADEMGLGKTIQGIGVAELLAQHEDIRKVLVICPASLKSQWRDEVYKFCDRDVQLISGRTAERADQYNNDCFFTVCNYEQVLRDLEAIDRTPWDLIILDEGQRIKNWEAKTSRIIKSLRSRYALVLTGTPLENRLDDLYSIVQFVDDRRLGPGFRFFNHHRILDEKGKILGYKNLADLRDTLKPILLRRTRESVKLELPERTTEIIRIPPTQEQLTSHNSHMQVVAAITRKRYLTEMDLLRLQKELMACRMVADSTYLLDKQEPGASSKLACLDDLLGQLFEEDEGRKAVVFSEWTTMLDLIEPLLEKRNVPFVRLDGKVPQKKRQELVQRFQNDPNCGVFLTTNAGSVGLNLQSANTVINIDLPWNPAVLEQRIARAHRMGQKQPIQVFVLITEQTLEESLLATLVAKKDLALAALDIDSEVEEVQLQSGLQELKSRLEILLGAHEEAPVKELEQQQVSDQLEQQRLEHQQRVAAAGGELLGAAFKLLGELVTPENAPAPSAQLVSSLRAGLEACVEGDEQPRLTISLPDRSVLDQLSQSLARLLVVQNNSPQPTDESTTILNSPRFRTSR